MFFVVSCLVLLIAALAVLVSTFVVALRVDCRFFGRRFEGNPYVRYFTAKDFEGLMSEPISFLSDKGQTLRGFVYRQADVKQKALIVFAHGYGAGHLAYTTEISFLAKSGYAVLAFDVTGCGESGGNCLPGFDQGPLDLAAAIEFAKRFPAFTDLPVLLVGHSWGAFSVMNVLPMYHDIRGAVAMCGFIGGASVVAQSACKGRRVPTAFLSIWLRLFNRLRYKKAANRSSVRSLRRSAQPLLLMYGGKDATIFYPQNGARVARAVKKRPKTQYFFYSEKGHNVYLTEGAETLMHRCLDHVPAGVPRDPEGLRAYYGGLDYRKMTEEDTEVMRSIAAFLERCL